jgi:peptidoglycan LD-endopeptidase LytH
MKSRRRRRLRDETIAPWIIILVILGVWWAGQKLIRQSPFAAAVREPVVEQDARTAADARRNSAARATDSARDATPTRDATNGADAANAVRSDDNGRAVVPVVGIDADTLKSTFDEARGAGARRHEAMDILAPRGTPVVAAVAGRVVKLFTSAAGGLTVYQFDVREEYCYYYAHLDAYAADLTEGQVVAKGQIIGYVGTTGNAPPGTPHLHFAIFRLGSDKHWWEGEPVDPITFLR